MAVISMGAPAPESLAPRASHGATSGQARTTRTRRNHGCCLIGGQLASVYSSRRGGDGLGVTLTIGSGAFVLSGGMTPAQARSLAKALTLAAGAADAKGGA